MDHEDGDGDGDGDGAGFGGGVDGDSRGGMEKTSGGDSGGVSPLRSATSWSLFLVSLVWRTSRRKASGDLLYRRF